MEFRKIFSVGLIVGIFSAVAINVQAQALSITNPSVEKVETAISQILADRVSFKKDMFKIDSLSMVDLMEQEAILFPADDVYASVWENQYVDPYKRHNVAIPDSFKIDCSKYVAPHTGHVTSKFGPRRRRMHKGIDLKVQVGDTIRAAFDGKIRVKYYERRGYGYYLIVRHTNGLETVYGHLSKFLVDTNQIVKAGQPIALGGNTGRSTGSHLHFEARFLGQAINPAEIFDFENYVAHKDEFVFRKTKARTATRGVYASAAGGGVSGDKYVIRKGDTLERIARRCGTSVKKLCANNNITPTTTLQIGRKLNL